MQSIRSSSNHSQLPSVPPSLSSVVQTTAKPQSVLPHVHTHSNDCSFSPSHTLYVYTHSVFQWLILAEPAEQPRAVVVPLPRTKESR